MFAEHQFVSGSQLAAVVDGLVIPCEGGAIRGALAALDRLQAKVVAAVGEYERAGGWEIDGAGSMVSWLRSAGLTRSRAASVRATGRRLGELPGVAVAWSSGRLSGGQVDALLANVTDRTVAVLAEQEHEVVDAIADLSVADTATVAQAWRQRAEALVDDPSPHDDPVRAVHLAATLDGRYEGTMSLDAAGGAVVEAGLDLVVRSDGDGPADPARSPAQRRGDALVDVFQFFLDHQQEVRGGRHRPHLNVVVEHDALVAGGGGRVVGGPVLDGIDVETIFCDSAVHRVVRAGRSSILDYGTATRTIPVNLYQAVVLRDGGCRDPWCDRPPGWCDVHHLDLVSHGGATRIDQLVLLCRRHHRRLHARLRRGWTHQLDPDGTYRLIRPDGVAFTSTPPGLLPELRPAPVPTGAHA